MKRTIQSVLALLFFTIASSAWTAEIRLTYSYWGSPQEKKAVDLIIQRFNRANAGKIKVEAVNIPGDQYDTKLTTMIAGGNAPDVARLESASIAFPIAEEKRMLNLLDFVRKDSTFKLSALPPNTTYWLNTDFLMGIAPGPEVFCLFYSEEAFAAAGLPPPPANPSEAWDWSAFVETAKKLTIDQNGKNATQAGFDPKKIRQFGVDFGKWWGVWGNFVYANGGDFVSQDGASFALDKAPAVEALQRLADLVNVHHVAPSPIQAKALPNSTVSLQTKRIAMVIDGQWSNLDLGNAGVKYNIGALPKMGGKSTTLVVCGMDSILSSTKHPAEAWEFLKALSDPEGTYDLIQSGLWMPARKNWYTDPALVARWATGNKHHPAGYKDAVLGGLLTYSVPGPSFNVVNFGKIMDLVNPALDRVWAGEIDAKEAMASVAPKAAALVKGRRFLGKQE